MIIFLLILFTFFLTAGVIVSKNNIFSPSVITPAIWIGCLFLFLVLNHNLPSLTSQLLGAVSLWVFLYTFSAMLMQSIRFSNRESCDPSKFVMDVYFVLSICSFPLLIMFAYKAIALGNSGHWALDLRLAAVGKTETFTEMYGGLYIGLWNITYLIELSVFSRKNRKRVFLLAFFILLYASLTMSKFTFLDLFLKTVCVLYFSRKVTLKTLLIGLGILFFFFVSLTSIRHNASFEGSDILKVYVLGNMSSFDTLEPISSTHWGENTFRILYAILYKIKLIDFEPVHAILPWISEPLSTNTYTGMYPFFVDFGYWGVGIFAMFYGLILGWIFNKAQNGSVLYMLIFAMFVSSIVTQYSGDVFFTYLAGNIKNIIMLIIPFLATKYKWFILKKQ